MRILGILQQCHFLEKNEIRAFAASNDLGCHVIVRPTDHERRIFSDLRPNKANTSPIEDAIMTQTNTGENSGVTTSGKKIVWGLMGIKLMIDTVTAGVKVSCFSNLNLANSWPSIEWPPTPST